MPSKFKIKYVSWLPGNADGAAPFPNQTIYLGEWTKKWPTRRVERLVAHEMVHLNQHDRDGWLKWFTRYIFSGWWRYVYEAEAFTQNLLHIYGKQVPDGVVNAYVRRILDNYYPRFWFGWKTKPKLDKAKAILVSFVDAEVMWINP